MGIQYSASALGLRNTINKNIKTDYGAVGDGSTDDAQKFVDFQTFAAAQTLPVTLTEPAGTYNLSTGSTAHFWMRGVKSARLLGAGQGVTTMSSTGSVQFGGQGLAFNNLLSARCATVLSGASSVTLSTSSEASRFTVGQYAMLAGIDLQGYGDPCNPHFFDIVKILSASTVTGVVGFDRAITHDYKSTWPLYNNGANWATGGGMDQGGPATLYALSTYVCEVEIRDQTITQGNNQTYAQGASIAYRNVTFTGAGGAIPSQNYLWRAIGCTYSGTSSIEFDKCVKEASFDTCSLQNVNIQSSSVDLLRMTDSTVNNLFGTPKAAIITRGTIAEFRPGAVAYGRSDSVTIVGPITISAFQSGGYTYAGAGLTGFSVEYSMSGGVITCPNSASAQPWAVPGTWCFWRGTNGYEGIFRVVDVTQDVTNTYIQTDQIGGFPISAGTLNVSPHPCPTWNCSSATGCDEIVDLSQSGAQGRPLYEYSKRTYAGVVTAGARLLTDAGLSSTLWPTMVGAIQSIKINVTTAYTGAGALTFKLSQFDNIKYRKTDGTVITTLGVTINAKVTGERVIAPVALGGNSGQQSGDTTLPTIPSGAWFLGKTGNVVLSADVSGNAAGPVITVEIVTSQGIT